MKEKLIDFKPTLRKGQRYVVVNKSFNDMIISNNVTIVLYKDPFLFRVTLDATGGTYYYQVNDKGVNVFADHLQIKILEKEEEKEKLYIYTYLNKSGNILSRNIKSTDNLDIKYFEKLDNFISKTISLQILEDGF